MNFAADQVGPEASGQSVRSPILADPQGSFPKARWGGGWYSLPNPCRGAASLAEHCRFLDGTGTPLAGLCFPTGPMANAPSFCDRYDAYGLTRPLASASPDGVHYSIPSPWTGPASGL